MKFSLLALLIAFLLCSCSSLEHFGEVKKKKVIISQGEVKASLWDHFLYKNFRIGSDYKEKLKAGTIWKVTDDEYVLEYVDSKPGCFDKNDVDDRQIITVLKEDFDTAKYVFLGQKAFVSASGHNISIVNREVEYIWCTIGPPILAHNYYYSFREVRHTSAKAN